jgi:hypothetical protein
MDSVPRAERRAYDRQSPARRRDIAMLLGLSQMTCSMVIAAQIDKRRLFHPTAIKR